MRDAHEDWRNLLLGFHYGGVPSINSVHSLYQFLDKPWVVSLSPVFSYYWCTLFVTGLPLAGERDVALW